MYFLALATDYDGTLAAQGIVSPSTLAALEGLKAAGRKLILVTGRELPDLKRVFPELLVFDRVVAENGALLYTPATEEERPIAPPPPPQFVERLQMLGVTPLSVGHSIVATWEPHETLVLELIRELGLELEVIFNKGAVMVLPSGVNKATGLAAALAEMGLSEHNVAGIGDAQNDHAFLRACGCSVAVANALPAVKDTADLVTVGARGQGVEELIEALLTRDAELARTERNAVALGLGPEDKPRLLLPLDVLLIAGSSGVGKSTLAIAITEGLVDHAQQFCILDPEGDYDGLDHAVTAGDVGTPPSADQVMQLLDHPKGNVVVNTLALKLEERPGFFADLMPRLSALRAATGRPHWIIIDEAHHLLPATHDSASLAMPMGMPGTIMITVHPDALVREALRAVTAFVGVGPDAREAIAKFCDATGDSPPGDGAAAPSGEQILLWRRDPPAAPQIIRAAQPRQKLRRHSRKYATGDLGDERSFYFRGKDGRLNLRAHNLVMFLQLAEGLDPATWEHHLRRGDYSAWFRDHIKDEALAEETAAVEADRKLSADDSRARIAEAVRRRYTAPASEREA